MTSAELRKIHKPLIEKKRRERINSSLDQLKSIVLESLQKDPSQYSKLEKADILEMTVKYLRSVHAQRTLASTPSAWSSYNGGDNNSCGGGGGGNGGTVTNEALNKYRAGFAECLQEVNHCLTSIKGLSADSHSQLMAHLANCLRHTERVGTPSSFCQSNNTTNNMHMITATTSPSIPMNHSSSSSITPPALSPRHTPYFLPIQPARRSIENNNNVNNNDSADGNGSGYLDINKNTNNHHHHHHHDHNTIINQHYHDHVVVLPKRPKVTKRRRSRPSSLPELDNNKFIMYNPITNNRQQSASVQPSCWRPW